MSSRDPIAVVMGTRPEGIKLAPVVQELRRRSPVPPLVVSSGQHREMLDQALRLFDLKADVDLSVMTPGQTLHEITCRILERMRAVCREHRPRWIVVQGDTTTAFAAALAGFYEKIPVAHVEAGLRSGERYSPFPEEINRRLVDQLSTVLFAPTSRARSFLVREGFSPRDIHVTGNTVVDALLFARDAVRRNPPPLGSLPARTFDPCRMILVTAHRRESFGSPMRAMCRAMRRIVDSEPDTILVFPVHMNPNVRAPVNELLGGHPRIVLLPPLSYAEFVALLDRAHLVLTDSGGVQEEAPTFGKPVLVMRDVTERPEGIAAGVATLVGTSEARLVETTLSLLRDPAKYASMASGINPYGDGHAARRIAQVLDEAFSGDVRIRTGPDCGPAADSSWEAASSKRPGLPAGAPASPPSSTAAR